MSSREVLRQGELSAVNGKQFISDVNGNKNKQKASKKIKSFGVLGFLTLVLVFAAVLFGSGNLIPEAILERIVEETDVQYADAVQSKMLVFQQSLLNGEVPEDTAKLLKDSGVLVGYGSVDNFTESNQSSSSLSLKVGDKIVSAEDFVTEANNNLTLYNAFNTATYSRAAYYYDDTAKEVFREIGTSRNNYTEDSDLNTVVNSLIGDGSSVIINSVLENEGEDDEISYILNGESANSSEAAETFIEKISEKFLASTTDEATLDAADSIKVADTVSKEQRSSLFFLAFMENISKMKAGEGNSSQINEMMNFLYTEDESEVVDVNTGEIVKSSGTPLESPSLYAILADSEINVEDVQNYSTERTLKTIENQVGVENATSSISGTIASFASKIKGAIGRFITSTDAQASSETLSVLSSTVESSLINNSYDTVKGIDAGELLVEGAINVGGKLAAASGGTIGDTETVLAYNHLNSNIVAMDAEIDRMNRSPFDVSSKNTFLGSIVYNMAIAVGGSDNIILNSFGSIMKVTSNSLVKLLPTSYAESVSGYLSNFGDCETMANIGAVGSAGCSKIITFDTDTLNDPYNDSGFTTFVEENTELVDGVRKIKDGSVLGDFVKYSDRITPVGVVDGGILYSLLSDSSSIPFIGDIVGFVERLLGASEDEIRIANGAAFVNSSSNEDWETYKYAQRYVSLARATDVMKQYTSDTTAYDDLLYFEGEENPVIAYKNTYLATR